MLKILLVKQKLKTRKLSEKEKLEYKFFKKILIEQASSVEEINRLEILLKTGQLSNKIFDQKLKEL